jgi:hypothetical protein
MLMVEQLSIAEKILPPLGWDSVECPYDAVETGYAMAWKHPAMPGLVIRWRVEGYDVACDHYCIAGFTGADEATGGPRDEWAVITAAEFCKQITPLADWCSPTPAHVGRKVFDILLKLAERDEMLTFGGTSPRMNQTTGMRSSRWPPDACHADVLLRLVNGDEVKGDDEC